MEITGYESLNELCDLIKGADEGELMLTVRALNELISRYLNAEIDSIELCEYASNVELRDEIDYELNNESKIATALFLLSTPEINEELTEKSVHRIKEQLNT